MAPRELEQYRTTLVELRDRAVSGANYVAEAIAEDVAPPGTSAAPVHLADAAGETLEADLGAFQVEIDRLEEINAAIDRIESGAYGRCLECGSQIDKRRLEAIPYTSLCIDCAKTRESQPQPLI
jgi:DnaK suppressor protein